MTTEGQPELYKNKRGRFGVLNGGLFNEIRFPGRLVEDEDGNKNTYRSAPKIDFDGSFGSMFFEPDDILTGEDSLIYAFKKRRDEDGLVSQRNKFRIGILAQQPALICCTGLVKKADGTIAFEESGSGPTFKNRTLRHDNGQVVTSLPAPDIVRPKFVNTNDGVVVMMPTGRAESAKLSDTDFRRRFKIDLLDRSAVGQSTNADGCRVYNVSYEDNPSRFVIKAFKLSDGTSTNVYQVDVSVSLTWVTEKILEPPK